MRGGERAVVADTPVGPLGLSICYDLRFAGLYRRSPTPARPILAIPAAFTVPTGEAHWHVLMRARAIEAGAFVVAAAQVGRHEDGRETYGHSLVVDPWGKVLLDMGGEEPGLGFAELDLGGGRGGARAGCRRSATAGRSRRRSMPAVIIFDLKCAPQGHVFEAWFGSTDDYEAQQARGPGRLPALRRGRGRQGADGARGRRQGQSRRRPPPEAVKAMLAAMAAAQKQMLEKSEHVGDRFADEARAIHLGEAEARAIHGRATRRGREPERRGHPGRALALPGGRARRGELTAAQAHAPEPRAGARPRSSAG